MDDSYPANIDFEFDRDQLRKYLRTQYFCGWLGGIGFFGGLLSLPIIAGAFERHLFEGLNTAALFALGTAVIAFVATLTVVFSLYLIFSHRVAARISESSRLSVEGPFLHLYQNGAAMHDRKLHFRSIVDYAIVQDRMMRRFGIACLQMNTTAGGATSLVRVLGVKDCLKVRDELAEIDRLRENG